MKTIRIVIYTFLVAIILNSCAKEYSAEQMAAPTGYWQFNEGSNSFSGFVTDFHINRGTINQYTFTGKTLDGNQNFIMNLYADSLRSGTYLASQFEATFFYKDALNHSIYTANQFVDDFIVNVNVISASIMNITFSGTAVNGSGNEVQISNGILNIK